jgi:protein-ribulosamine 3-kinase
MWNQIEQHISESIGEPFTIEDHAPVGGGSINRAYRVTGSGRRSYFVKTNHGSLGDMFVAEAEGLAEMARSNAIRVPFPICHGVANGESYIVLEHINFGGQSDPGEFGKQLANMHRSTNRQFGWHIDNTIGSTPQPNGPSDDWIAFWREQRLGFQLDLAKRNGYGGNLQRKGQRLMEEVPRFFDGYTPEPSLLHGDLWSGNWDYDRAGNPVIFDPAVYYGDREADLAMTELFGSPGRAFYEAYDRAWPVDDGYRARKILYNLYHIINHLNLFGGGYGGQAESMMDRLLSAH